MSEQRVTFLLLSEPWVLLVIREWPGARKQEIVPWVAAKRQGDIEVTTRKISKSMTMGEIMVSGGRSQARRRGECA